MGGEFYLSFFDFNELVYFRASSRLFGFRADFRVSCRLLRLRANYKSKVSVRVSVAFRLYDPIPCDDIMALVLL